MRLAGLRSFVARASELFRRGRLARELEEEMRHHLDLEIQYNVGRGMSAEDARRVALASFGGVRRYAEETHDARGFVMLDNIGRDFRFALRRLRRAPAFSAGVVATLSIGIAATVAVGTLVVDVLVRPLPYDRPATLARVLVRAPGLGGTSTESSEGVFTLFRERSRSFSTLATYYENDG